VVDYQGLGQPLTAQFPSTGPWERLMWEKVDVSRHYVHIVSNLKPNENINMLVIAH
jgi:hypothetical protein